MYIYQKRVPDGFQAVALPVVEAVEHLHYQPLPKKKSEEKRVSFILLK